MQRNSKSTNLRDWNCHRLLFLLSDVPSLLFFVFVLFCCFVLFLFKKLLCSFTTNHHLDSQILYFVVYFDLFLCFLKLVDTVSLFPLLHAQIISNWNEYLTAYERSRHSTDPKLVILWNLKKFLLCLIHVKNLGYLKW